MNFYLIKRIGNHRFRIPLFYNIGWNNIFESEPWMYQLLRGIFSEREGIFVDIGVNIGQTLLKVKGVSDKITYYGFEVNPTCIFYLNQLIKANNFTDTHLIPVGLSDKSAIKRLNFFSKYEDDATATIIENLRPGAYIEKSEYVYLSTLDEFVNEINGLISVIKIDVEGAEPDVLQGAVNTIKKHRPIIILEILPAYNLSNTWRVERQHQLEQFFLKSDYRIVQIRKDKRNGLASFLAIEKLEITADILERDFLFIPKEAELRFIK